MSRHITHIYVWNPCVYNDAKKTDMYWENYCGHWSDILEGPQLSSMQKPYALILRLMLIYTNKGESIIDPTCGTGTTLKVGDDYGRFVTGCENDAATYEIARRRLGL